MKRTLSSLNNPWLLGGIVYFVLVAIWLVMHLVSGHITFGGLLFEMLLDAFLATIFALCVVAVGRIRTRP